MGGNALHTVTTRRYERNEYYALKDEVESILSAQFEKVFITTGFQNKKDFGDMDCIVSYLKNPYSYLDSKSDPTLISLPPFDLAITLQDKKHKPTRDAMLKTMIQMVFSPREIFINDDVISFDYKDFQIDIIYSPNYFETSVFYIKNGDLGNLLGRIAYSTGLELGHKTGLTCRYETKQSNYLEPIVLSTTPDEILEYLGLDPTVFNKGFEEEEAIFKYAASSTKFNGHLYKWENLNNENRTRNKKRPFYQRFVAFLTESGMIEENKLEYNILDFSNEQIKKLQVEAIHHFAKDSILNELLRKERIKDYLASRFNGELVSGWTGLKIKSKELGDFMKRYKESFKTPLIFENFLLDQENDVKKSVIKFYMSEGLNT